MIDVPVPKVGPELKSVSPSQVREFELCSRKHWLNKRAGLPQPEGDHLVVGTGGHSAIESYFETGEMFEPERFSNFYFSKTRPDLVPTLTTALKSAVLLLADPDAPRPKPGLLIEQPRNYNTGMKIAGVPIRQRSDLADPTDPSLIKSFDWKSSSRVFSDFTKTGEQLMYDAQGVFYAAELFHKYKPEAVVFHHGVFGTETVEAQLIATDPMTKEHVDREFSRFGEIVREMREHFAINNFHDTRPGKGGPSASYDSPCRAFKGCPYAAVCGVELPVKKSAELPLTTEQTMTAPTLTLKERLAKAKLATGINPGDAAPPLPVTPYVPASASATQPPAPGATSSTVTVRELVTRIEADLATLKALVQ